MNGIVIDRGDVQVDASIIADGLRLVIDQAGHVLERSATVLASPTRHARTGRRGGSTR
jgi:hypothetical protein